MHGKSMVNGCAKVEFEKIKEKIEDDIVQNG